MLTPLISLVFLVQTPTDAEVATEIEKVATARRVPTTIAKGLAWHESRWTMTANRTGRIGLFGVLASGRTDTEKLQSDWRYNVAEGIKSLELAWNRAPIVGATKLDDGRNILECWFHALGRYGVGKEGAEAHAYANAVLDGIHTGGENRFTPVSVTRPAPEALSWGRNLPSIPTPWHFGDVTPRQPSKPVVSLTIPYVHQAWDTPDDFPYGGGACGPTSLTMALAFFGKLTPKPIEITASYPHTTDYGAHVAELYPLVCEPGRGAIHAKMLDYLRPLFPDVAIYYDEKATYARVKAELDAGRPVLLGVRVTPAGHIILARGYLSDGRILCNDPAGDREQLARVGGPQGLWSKTGSRYWSPGGDKAVYEWDALQVRWVMTFAKQPDAPDAPEDASKPLPSTDKP
jgi:hypothetical protein